MSSRMYAFGASDSSDSDTDEGSPVRVENRYMPHQSDDEEDKRVVRSARDKRLEEMQTIIKNMNNHKKIKDMSNIFTAFESLVRVYEKSVKMNELDGVPPLYVRCITELEDYVNDKWETRRDMTKTAAKALTILKQRVKKYNRDFEEQIKDFREHPENYEEEAEAVSADDEDSADVPETPRKSATSVSALDAKKSVKKKSATRTSSGESEKDDDVDERVDEDDGSDSDDDWDSDSSDSSSSSDGGLDMEQFKDDPSVYFLKKTTDDKQKDKSKAKKVAKERPDRKKQSKMSSALFDDGDGVWTTVDASGRPEVQVQAFEKGQEITFVVVLKRLTEILMSRGKKGTNLTEQTLLLLQVEEKVKEHRMPAGLHAKVMFSLISVLFDYDRKKINCLSGTAFDRLLNAFDRLFDVLEHQKIELITPDENIEPEESLEHPPYKVTGSILTAIKLLDDECTKVLQHADGHEVEYIERLKDERRVCALLDRLCAFLEQRDGSEEALCAAYLLKVEHLYYKFDFHWARRVEAEGMDVVGPNESTAVIQKLCKYIYSHDRTDRLRTRAILCQIYHFALYDDWFKARDLMLMSSLQMTIEHADHSTMILYNRAMVQLGLAAFRQGHIRDAHYALTDLIGSGRIRELLAQGLHQQTRYERSPEEERREQALQMPYHMYINTDMLDCVYLISAMLLEIPNLAAHDTDLRWRPISKPFHLALRMHDRATLNGPPETPRDHVLAAAKAMRYGNWKACIDNIFNPKMSTKIWNTFFHAARVRVSLEKKIKEESLRSFLFTYSALHDSMNLDRLAESFNLPKQTVYSIISKMITNQELAASLEVPSNFLIMHKTGRSRLQTIALQMSDKFNSIVEMNEKLIESRGSGGGGLLSSKSYQSYQGPRRQPMRYAMTKFN